MWVIQNDHLFSLPDTAPLPPGSAQISLPDDFLMNHRAYKIQNGAITKRTPKEMQAASKKKVPPLTDEEILRLRAAIHKGTI
jgi:hypothetical protein